MPDTVLNEHSPIADRQRVKLTVADFLLLKHAGVFSGYSKSELLDGELWGVPVQAEDEPESDAVYPIKLRIEDYLRLSEAGAFAGYRKTELIDGVVYAMSPQFSSHADAKGLVYRRLADSVETALPGHRVWSEASVAIEPDDTPAPDIFVTSFRPRPRAITPVETVRLVVEIADTTLREDLGPKLRLYARGGIPEYWVLDLKGRVIHQMWSPRDEAYAERRKWKLGERIEAATIEGLAIETTGIN
jgi:Uma2 family endonuclease